MKTSLTIPNGYALSNPAVMVGDQYPRTLYMPSAWDAANLTVMVSYDGVSFSNLYDGQGNEYTISAAAGIAINLDPAVFSGFKAMIFRSGTNGSPVNQTADRSLVLEVR